VHYGSWKLAGLAEVLLCLGNNRTADESLLPAVRLSDDINIWISGATPIKDAVSVSRCFDQAKICRKLLELDQVRMVEVDVADEILSPDI
jgi:hypothetical protein